MNPLGSNDFTFIVTMMREANRSYPLNIKDETTPTHHAFNLINWAEFWHQFWPDYRNIGCAETPQRFLLSDAVQGV